jgi:hypothetical protein
VKPLILVTALVAAAAGAAACWVIRNGCVVRITPDQAEFASDVLLDIEQLTEPR